MGLMDRRGNVWSTVNDIASNEAGIRLMDPRRNDNIASLFSTPVALDISVGVLQTE